jgi:micrococcal nuclease
MPKKRRFYKPRRLPAVVAAVLLAFVLARVFLFPGARTEDAFSRNLAEGEYPVVRVVDGDTILVFHQGDNVRVRLLGIDTPETVKKDHPVEFMGPEASEFTEEFLKKGVCWLRFDRRRVDQYGRWLAYVYVDDAMLNEELVRRGLASVSVYPGDSASIERQLRKAEDEAKKNGRGIWSRSR